MLSFSTVPAAHPGSLAFRIETNGFQNIKDLERAKWYSIEREAKDSYRAYESPFDKEHGYTYAYTGTKVLEQDWARFGQVLILTGWQDFPEIENRHSAIEKYILHKKYNLHVLAIKGDQCFFVTFTQNQEIKIDDKNVSAILEFIHENKTITTIEQAVSSGGHEPSSSASTTSEADPEIRPRSGRHKL